MADEFLTWEDALVPDLGVVTKWTGGRVRRRPAPVYPNPREVGGLPDGWQVRWYACHPTGKDGADGTYDVVVVERDGGGWTTLLHWYDADHEPSTIKWTASAVTVAALYDHTDPTDEAGQEPDLHAFILSSYNMTNETEAAEATLVGLGAPITVFPRALTRV